MRNDIHRSRLTEREKLACSPHMKEQMQAIADRRGISRSQIWREAAAAYIAAQGESEQ